MGNSKKKLQRLKIINPQIFHWTAKFNLHTLISSTIPSKITNIFINSAKQLFRILKEIHKLISSTSVQQKTTKMHHNNLLNSYKITFIPAIFYIIIHLTEKSHWCRWYIYPLYICHALSREWKRWWVFFRVKTRHKKWNTEREKKHFFSVDEIKKNEKRKKKTNDEKKIFFFVLLPPEHEEEIILFSEDRRDVWMIKVHNAH